MATLIKIDKNGSKHYQGMVTCPRCQGLGLYAIGVWNGRLKITEVDNGVCHRCLGEGKILGKWIERTPEYQAKLDARRQAKIEAEREEREAERARIEAERKAEEERKEAERKAERAKSQFFGNIGDKVELELTYIRSASWESRFGTQYLHIFKDADGNAFTWKTSSGLGREIRKDGCVKWEGIEREEVVKVKGTIKDHDEYDGQKQTVLTRCKIA